MSKNIFKRIDTPIYKSVATDNPEFPSGSKPEKLEGVLWLATLVVTPEKQVNFIKPLLVKQTSFDAELIRPENVIVPVVLRKGSIYWHITEVRTGRGFFDINAKTRDSLIEEFKAKFAKCGFFSNIRFEEFCASLLDPPTINDVSELFFNIPKEEVK